MSELAAEQSARKDGALRKEACELTCQVLRYAMLFSIFVMMLFLFFSREIGMAFYREKAVGSMIRILAPLVPFMYLESIVDGMLTALDQQVSIMKYNMIDGVGRLFLVMLLLPHFGMNGFLGMMYVSNLYTSLACIRKLLQVTGIEIPVTEWILLPLLAAGIAGFGVSALAKLMVGVPQLLLLGTECLLSGLVYGSCLLLQGTVTVEEIFVPLRRILFRRRRHA